MRTGGCCRTVDREISRFPCKERLHMPGSLTTPGRPVHAAANTRCSSWAYSSLNSPSHFSLPRYGSRVGLHIVLFKACSTFTRVAACTLALSPIRDTLIEGFSHFVTSMTAPIASGWSDCRVGFSPTGKRRLCTAHARSSRQLNPDDDLGRTRCGARRLGVPCDCPALEAAFRAASKAPSAWGRHSRGCRA